VADQELYDIRGRGAAGNPPNRFERTGIVREEVDDGVELCTVETEVFRDTSRTIISSNDSPDIGFDRSINPYRGCEHGCAYCYARPTHEFLGFSAGLDFESRIVVKEDAAALLRRELAAPGWTPQLIALSGVTDPYQPLERRLEVTRRCLEVLVEFRNPVGITTKSHLVVRDSDLLAELCRFGAALVALSVTTLDRGLARRLEPRAPTPEARLDAVRQLRESGVCVGVSVAPIIPGLTDHEIPAIVDAAAKAGASFATYITLRLPYGVSSLFETWLDRNFPDRKEKVLNRLRAMRDGSLNDPKFGSRMKGSGPYAEQIGDLFRISCRRAGLRSRPPRLSTAAFRRPRPDGQLSLFDDLGG
jgi:DNA repair photolyase